MVMAILGLLAGFGATRYPGVQKSARDARRKSDLKQYHTSLESFANRKGGFYPSRTSATNASDLSCNPSPCTTSLCSDLGLSRCPTDPKMGQNICASGTCNYYYLSNGTDGTASASKFVLYSLLEKQVNDQNVYFVVCSGGATGTIAKTSWATPGSTCPL